MINVMHATKSDIRLLIDCSDIRRASQGTFFFFFSFDNVFSPGSVRPLWCSGVSAMQGARRAALYFTCQCLTPSLLLWL